MLSMTEKLLEGLEGINHSHVGTIEDNMMLREDIVEILKDMKDYLNDEGDALFAMSNMYLSSYMGHLQDIPKDIYGAITVEFLSKGFALDIRNEMLERIGSLPQGIDEGKGYLKDIASIKNSEWTEETLGKFKEGLTDLAYGLRLLNSRDGKEEIWGKVESFCISRAQDRLESLPENVKEAIAENADKSGMEGIFFYAKDQEGNADKENIVANAGLFVCDNGALTDNFGISMEGRFTDYTKDFSSERLGIHIDELNAINGEKSELCIKDNDKQSIMGAFEKYHGARVDLRPSEITYTENENRALELYGKATQAVYGIELVDASLIEKAINDFESKGEEKKENDIDNRSPGPVNVEAGATGGFHAGLASNERVIQGGKTSFGEKSGTAEEFTKHSVKWDKTGDGRLDSIIGTRNQYIDKGGISAHYRTNPVYCYKSMTAAFYAYKNNIPINGMEVKLSDCYTLFMSFCNSDIVSVGVYKLIDWIGDKVRSSDKADVGTDVSERHKITAGELRSVAADISERADQIDKSKAVDRLQAVIERVGRSDDPSFRDGRGENGLYKNAEVSAGIKKIISLYGAQDGPGVVRDSIKGAVINLMSDLAVPGSKVDREKISELDSGLKELRGYKVDGEYVKINLKGISEEIRSDIDKEEEKRDTVQGENTEPLDGQDVDEEIDRKDEETENEAEPGSSTYEMDPEKKDEDIEQNIDSETNPDKDSGESRHDWENEEQGGESMESKEFEPGDEDTDVGDTSLMESEEYGATEPGMDNEGGSVTDEDDPEDMEATEDEQSYDEEYAFRDDEDAGTGSGYSTLADALAGAGFLNKESRNDTLETVIAAVGNDSNSGHPDKYENKDEANGEDANGNVSDNVSEDGITGNSTDAQVIVESPNESVEDGSEKDEKQENEDIDIYGIHDAIEGYINNDLDISSFLNSEISVNGQDMTIMETLTDPAILDTAVEIIAGALADKVIEHNETINEDEELCSRFSELVSGIYGTDELAGFINDCGFLVLVEDKIDAECDKMDPSSSVADAVYDAFDKMTDSLFVADYTLADQIIDTMIDFFSFTQELISSCIGIVEDAITGLVDGVDDTGHDLTTNDHVAIDTETQVENDLERNMQVDAGPTDVFAGDVFGQQSEMADSPDITQMDNMYTVPDTSGLQESAFVDIGMGYDAGTDLSWCQDPAVDTEQPDIVNENGYDSIDSESFD